MENSQPVTEWPDRPLTEAEAADLLDGEVRAVHVMDHGDAVRAGVDAAEDEVIEVVTETDEAFWMYSYAADPGDGGAEWREYGHEPKDGEGGRTMRETLASYRVLAGEPAESVDEGG
jgi:hypothetical protein